MQSKLIVLFGHGARDPQWADPMRLLQSKLVSQLEPGVAVELAFLELMEPTLPAVIGKAAEGGVEQVSIIPIFFGRGGHLKKDFPLIMKDLRERYPHIEITASEAVGQWESVWDAIAAGILSSQR